MPRNTTRAATKQQQVQKTGQIVGREVHARVSTGGRPPPEAFAFADLIRAGGSLYEAIEKPRQETKAEIDFETGQVDEPEGGYYYRQKVDSLKARAWWAEDEKKILEKFKDVDTHNISSQELDAWLDNEYSQLYGGMEENTVMSSELLPGMKKLRESLHEEVYTTQSELEVQENAAHIATIHERNYENGSFSHHSLHDDIMGTFKGADRNKQFAMTVFDMAIRNGDVGLIDNIPTRWEDGTPTIAADPNWNEQILNARVRALAARATMDKAAEDAAEAENDALFNDVSIKAMELTLQGDEAGAQRLIYGLAQTPGQKAKDILNMHKGMSALSGVVQKLPQDHNEVARITAEVYSGEASQSDVVEAWGLGIFGTDDQGLSTYRTLLSHLSSRAKSDPETNRQFNFNVGLIKSKYNPKRNGELGAINIELQELRDTALKMYERMVYDEGKNAGEAADEVFKIFDDRMNRMPSAAIRIGQQANLGESIGHLIARDMTPTQARRAGVTVDALDQALAAQIISDAQYEYALELLGE